MDLNQKQVRNAEFQAHPQTHGISLHLSRMPEFEEFYLLIFRETALSSTLSD